MKPSSNDNSTVHFPDGWDKTNPSMVSYYEKCKDYVSSTEDMVKLFDISWFYHFYCLFLFIISLLSAFFAIKLRNKIKILKTNIVLIIFYTFGCIACTINSYFIQTKYSTYPCVAYFYLTSIGYSMVLITSFGCIINYLKQCYFSVYLYNKAVNNEIKKSRSLLHRICEVYTQSRLLNFLLTFVILQLSYSLYISYVNDNYSLVYIKKGFCGFTMEYLPQIILVCLFLFVSFPLIVYQFYRLHDKFKFVNTLMINLLLMTISAGLFIYAMVVPSYNCSQIVRYLPSDAYGLIVSCSFHYSQVIKPILNYYYINRKSYNLEINTNGLITVLDDEILFNEFFEFCKQKCCIENALFYTEYKKFIRLVNILAKKNKRNLSISEYYIAKLSKSNNKLGGSENNFNDQQKIEKIHSKDSNISNGEQHRSILDIFRSSDPEFINMKEGKKRAAAYYEIHKLANEIYKKFIDENSNHEINIPEKARKEIKTKLISHNQSYSNEKFGSINNVKLDIENIFDEAYEIILQDLYLNVYIDYMYKKDKNNNDNNDNNKQNNNKRKNKEIEVDGSTENNCNNVIIDNSNIISNDENKDDQDTTENDINCNRTY